MLNQQNCLELLLGRNLKTMEIQEIELACFYQDYFLLLQTCRLLGSDHLIFYGGEVDIFFIHDTIFLFAYKTKRTIFFSGKLGPRNLFQKIFLPPPPPP